MNSGEFLLYGGIILMIVGAVLAAVSLIVLRRSGKKLDQTLDQEYGPRPR